MMSIAVLKFCVRKRLVIGIMLAIASLSVSPFMASAAVEIPSSQIMDVGNKFCPIDGKRVNGKDFVVINGKRYGVCCPLEKVCKKAFREHPDKYIKKIIKREPELAKKIEG